MGKTFESATSIVSGGVAGWDVSSVTMTAQMFKGATKFDENLAAWTTTDLAYVQLMFSSASAFTGQGVASFNVGKVTNFNDAFTGAVGLTSCNKKRIDDAWRSNTVFKASDFGWTSDRCELM